MTALLEQAMRRVETLPKTEQDAIAALILDELDDERRWDEALAANQDQIAKLAQRALAEHRAGESRPLLFPE